MEMIKSNFALGLLQGFFEKIKSLVVEEAGLVLLFNDEDKLGKLERKLSTAHSLLDYFQQSASSNLQNCIEDAMRVCYDAEDLIDEFTIYASKKSSLPEKVILIFTRVRLVQKFQQLELRLDDVLKSLEIINRTNQREQERLLGDLHGFVVGKEDDMPIFREQLFGRDMDKEKIIAMLLQERIDLVCIVGMEGIGKTSLAQNVLSDFRIRDFFDHLVWLPISANFDTMKMSKFISNWGQELHGKNLFIVLDDILDVKDKDWSNFIAILSKFFAWKVLLTTSNLNVAVVTKATPHFLQLISDENCEAIISKRIMFSTALSDYEAECLRNVARMMAEKCKGLPLAASEIGYYLSHVTDNDELVKISHREISELKVFREEVFSKFWFKSADFASYLKRCFAYCSLFPSNYKFEKDLLVQLWMAEGFILQNGTKRHKQTGSDYFDELLWRCLFQISSPSDQDMLTYEMHEFIHLYAEFVASSAFCRLEKGECPNTLFWHKKVRHLSVDSNAVNVSFLKEIERCGGLRTLLFLSRDRIKIGEVPSSLFEKLGKLRVLDISFTDVAKLPKSVGKLKHLRYLDASYTKLSLLPYSILELHGLQVLKLLGCEIRELPLNFKDFTNLQHFEVDMSKMKLVPQGIGYLNTLETLSSLKLDNQKGSRITELKILKFLSGMFALFALENVRDGNEAKEALISEKPFIKRLVLEWGTLIDELKSLGVLDGLRPHNNLCELKITSYGGSSFPGWLSSLSCMLLSVHLCHCPNVTVLPPLGQLPFLKELLIEDLYGVMYIDYRFCGEGRHPAFPSLVTLEIHKMGSLIGWKNLPDCMFSLRKLVIANCPLFFVWDTLTHMKSLKHLEVKHCHMLKKLPALPVNLHSVNVADCGMVDQHYHGP